MENSVTIPVKVIPSASAVLPYFLPLENHFPGILF